MSFTLAIIMILAKESYSGHYINQAVQNIAALDALVVTECDLL